MPYADPEKQKQYHTEYRRRNKKKIREKIRELQKKNKEKYAASALKYQRKRRKQDPVFRAQNSLRARLNNFLKTGAVYNKPGSTMDLVGCTADELEAHLESQFTDGMNWSNYGTNGWHIDHIVPLSSVDPLNEEELRAVYHYTNLQPLWARDNIIKRDKVDKDED